MDRSSITPTPRQLRALTHPVRLRMLGLLRVDGPATATTLAARLGLNTGATSYHLRQLAEHGFIVDDVERGSGRERWWRAAHAATRVDEDETAPAVGGDELDAYLQAVVTVTTRLLQQAIEERPLLPRPWREASTFSDYRRRLTPAQARGLIEHLDAWLDDHTGDADDTDPDAAAYSVQLNVFPFPGALTEDPS